MWWVRECVVSVVREGVYGDGVLNALSLSDCVVIE